MAIADGGTGSQLWDEGAKKAAVRVLSLVAHPERRVEPSVVDAQCSKHCRGREGEVAAAIHSWLDWYRSTGFVRKDGVAAVFALLKAELATRIDDELVWALGTVDPYEVLRLGEEACASQHPWAEVADRAMDLIRGIAGSDDLLMPDSFRRGQKVSKDGIVSGGSLRVLEHTDRFPELVYAVVPSVTNLVRWIVLWRGVAIVDVLEEGVHPSLHGLVAKELAAKLGRGRATELLSSIEANSQNEVVALAIHETLRVASELRENERRAEWDISADPSSDVAQPDEDLLPVDALLQSLPTALAALATSRALGWIAQLLCEGEAIYGGTEPERMRDLDLLFSRAEEVAAELLSHADPVGAPLDELLAELVTSRRPSKVHHLGAIALHLEQPHPNKACAVRSALLREYKKLLTAARTTGGPLDGGDDGFRRDDAVAAALARPFAAHQVESATEFLDGLYSDLGLSIWECEEDHDQFRRDIQVAANLVGVGAMAAQYASLAESASSVALAQWCANRLWSNDLLVAHLEHGLDQWQKLDVLATVVLTMLKCLPDPETRLLSLMADARFPNRALSSVAKHAPNKELRDEAARVLALRFEDKVSLRPLDARQWANTFLAIGDAERGLRAMDMVPPTQLERTPYDHALCLRLVLSRLEAPQSEPEPDLRELKLWAQQSYRLARPYLMQEGMDQETRERMDAADLPL